MLILLIIALCATLIFVIKNLSDVKNTDVSISRNNNYNITEIYDNNNTIISEHKNNVNYSEIPQHTINAFLTIEDKSFFKHNGINYLRIAKATFNNIKSLSFKEGASTITQQLIKNKYLTNEKTLGRKIKEAYLAMKIEKEEPKEKILESYLNTIYYGHGIYGIENASRFYFNKPTSQLTLNESCVLAGLIKSPSYYSPINNYTNCIDRRNLVLEELLKDNLITKEEYENLINEDIQLEISIDNNDTDLYTQFALDEASKIMKMDKNKILQNGYKIYTYQDNLKQQYLDQAISNNKYYQKNEYGNIADSLSIIINNDTYGVSAISGKSEYNLVNFKRQPGSLVKPFLVYTPALENKLINKCSHILDEKVNFNGYSPKNVGNQYYGYISVDDAIAKSLNTPTVKLCNQLGIDKCKEYAIKCGIPLTNNDNGLSIALGGLTEGCTLKEITDAYSVYTNNGNYTKSKFIREIKNCNNTTIYTNLLSSSNVFMPDNAYLTTQSLAYSTKNGTSKKLSIFDYDIAGKTGTVNVKDSNLNTDAYSLAFTTSDTMCVWMGNYSMDNKYHLSGNNNGGTFATEIIKDVFSNLYINNTPEKFTKPDSIVSLPIDYISLANNHQVMLADKMPEKYIKYYDFSINNLPDKHSDILININDDTNLCSTSNSNSIILNFHTHDYYKYNLHRKLKNQDIIIATFNNKNGNQTYIDNNIIYNEDYTYYLEIISEYTHTSITSSPTHNRVKKNYQQLLDEQNNNSYQWIFQ